jgi:hypothetical protein
MIARLNHDNGIGLPTPLPKAIAAVWPSASLDQ